VFEDQNEARFGVGTGCGLVQGRGHMEKLSLTGAQKTRLRGLGQTLDDALRVGKAGFTHVQQRELSRLLDARELVKIRFEGADRHARAAMITQIETDVGASCVGAVGHTALFFRQNSEPERRVITV
jgi:RNA-binding protein